MWLTNKDTGGHFNTEWLEDDEHKKNREIEASKKQVDEKGYSDKVDSLPNPKGNKIFADSKISPIPYDKDKLMEVAFGDWKDNENNFQGVKSIPISSIVAVQPYVQANKLKSFKGDIDTSEIKVLQIDDKYYVGDGNHRLAAAMLKGDTTVKVKVYKPNKEKKTSGSYDDYLSPDDKRKYRDFQKRLNTLDNKSKATPNDYKKLENDISTFCRGKERTPLAFLQLLDEVKKAQDSHNWEQR